MGHHGNGDSLAGRSSHHLHDNVNGAGHEASCPGRHWSGKDVPHPQVDQSGELYSCSPGMSRMSMCPTTGSLLTLTSAKRSSGSALTGNSTYRQVQFVQVCVWERKSAWVTVSTTAVGRAREREVPTARRTDWCLLPAQPRSHGDDGPCQAADFPHSPSLD